MQKSSINNQNQPSQQQNSFENPVISAEVSHNEENVAEKSNNSGSNSHNQDDRALDSEKSINSNNNYSYTISIGGIETLENNPNLFKSKFIFFKYIYDYR